MRRLIAWGLLGIFSGLTFWYGAVSSAPLPDHHWLRGRNDLILHGLAFGALTLPLVVLVEIPLAFGLAILAAIIVEALQFGIPAREATIADVMASIAGIALVASAVLVVRKLTPVGTGDE